MGGRGSGRKGTATFVLAEDRPAFDRQPDEPNLAWDGFVAYRDLGLERSLAKAAAVIKKSKSLLDDWSARWGWVVRATAWDREVDQRKRAAALKGVEEMQAKHIQMAESLFGLSALELTKWVKRARAREGSPVTSLRDVSMLVEAAAKLERQARGEAAEKLELSGDPNRPVKVEQTIEVAGKIIRFS